MNPPNRNSAEVGRDVKDDYTSAGACPVDRHCRGDMDDDEKITASGWAFRRDGSRIVLMHNGVRGPEIPIDTIEKLSAGLSRMARDARMWKEQGE